MLTVVLTRPAAAVAQESAVKVAELSPEAEAAIDNALRYLARTQKPDGSWEGQYPEAFTAVAMMAFMVQGHFPDRGQYGTVMTRAVDFLIKSSKAGGGYMGNNMYAHALATLALSEVWGMSDRDDLRDCLKTAVKIILEAQSKDAGGWRYNPRPQDADISVTVMQIVALASAKEAGILVPDSVIKKALAYVKTCHDPKSGGFGYQPGGPPGFARTAAGIMSLIMSGERTSAIVKQGMAYLKDLPEAKFREQEYYFYGHYYAIQSMYQAGDQFYQPWYPKIRDALLAKQNKDGGWEDQGSRAFGTGLGVLILGVPYRYLPIYQR
jgi:hypothetical protein